MNRLEAGLKSLTPTEREAQLREVRGHLETRSQVTSPKVKITMRRRDSRLSNLAMPMA